LKKVRVVGIGNLVMHDDGLGPHLIQLLESMGDVPEGVELIDGGTHSYDLVEFFAEADAVIIIDALKFEEEPGTIYRAPFKELRPDPVNEAKSVHELNFIDAVNMVNMLGYDPEVIVFGMEPKVIDVGIELSPELAAKLPRLAELVKEEIQRLLA